MTIDFENLCVKGAREDLKKFDPWCGPQRNSTRSILVIGNSRYSSNRSDRMIIEEVVAKIERNGTFTKFLTALRRAMRESGYYRDADYARKLDLWNSLGFHNWVTTCIPKDNRKRIPLKFRRHAQNDALLREMIRRNEPTHAIIWGEQTWRDIRGMVAAKRLTISGTNHDYIIIGDTLVTWIKHPSTGFKYEKWVPILKSFLDMPPQAA